MKRRLIQFILLLFLSLLLSVNNLLVDNSPILALGPAIEQENSAKSFYQSRQFAQAIEHWQAAFKRYSTEGNAIGQARVSSNLALAYQQIGQWTEAENSIQNSLAIINQISPSIEQLEVYAQTLNNQGLIELARGRTEKALNSWVEATKVYRAIPDRTGVFRSQINQAIALKILGLYPRSCQVILQALEIRNLTCKDPENKAQTEKLAQYLNALPPDLETIQLTAWRILGETLQTLGKPTTAELIFQVLLSRSIEPEQRAKLSLGLGNVAQSRDNTEKALNWYRQATREAIDPRSQMQSSLALFKLYIDKNQIDSAIALIPTLEHLITLMPANADKISAQINFSSSLGQLKQISDSPKIFAWTGIAQILANALELAQNIGSPRLQSRALGDLAAIYERTQQYEIAQKLTESALLIAQSQLAPEITYRWQWQSGRIFAIQGKREQAIASYTEAVKTLNSIEQDLVAVDRNVRFSFQQEVEPVYRQLVSLLLTPDQKGEIAQAELVQARNVMESLRLAELNNFFREACLEAQPRSIETIDPQSAVIYPIILEDRLAIILSLPHQPLQYYTSPVPVNILKKTVNDFRFNLVVRPKRDFFPPAQQLYQWIIEPIEAQLAKNKIKTLIFILDGVLRNVPMSALYDGKEYLIEKYEIALTPGLQLLNPKRLQQTSLSILAAGLTKAKEGFPPLYFVADELKTIQKNLKSNILLNEAFTEKALREAILTFPFPLVHIATHGQFSSNFDETFLLAWDSRIDVRQLDKLLRGRDETGSGAIELLVLSACETAAGDDRAALGLAGLAIRSGARSTLATLWAVNDEATAEFMNRFYQSLVTDKLTKSAALQQAQLTLLKDRRYRHPFYWSPYVLLGNWL